MNRLGYAISDPATAYAVMGKRLGSCEEHGGTDAPETCEWCLLREMFSDEVKEVNA